MYFCRACNLAVIVFDERGKILEKPVKACGCKAPIRMDMSAKAKGVSGIKM